jgi:hypothetical protein
MSDRLDPRRTASRVIATELRPDAAGSPTAGIPRLARSLEIEHSWDPDREAMLAALRVALGLPRVPHRNSGGQR